MSEAASIDKLKHALRDLARRIDKRRKGYMTWLVIGIGLASFAVTFILLYLNPEGIDLKYTVTLGAFVPSLAIYVTLNHAYRRRAMRMLIDGVCQASGLQFRADGWFTIGAAERHKILPPHNKGRIEYGLQGSYRGINIDIQEIVLSELRQDPAHKKKQKEYLRFWGLLIRLRLSRSLGGHTVVIPHPAMQTFFRAYFSNYEPIKIAEGVFPKRYEVMGSDKVEAKLIVNGTFREQFMASAKALNAYWNEASFRENEILFAYQRFRPLFDVTPLWKPVTEKNLRTIADELESIARLVATIKANPQIGT